MSLLPTMIWLNISSSPHRITYARRLRPTSRTRLAGRDQYAGATIGNREKSLAPHCHPRAPVVIPVSENWHAMVARRSVDRRHAGNGNAGSSRPPRTEQPARLLWPIGVEIGLQQRELDQVVLRAAA